MYPLPRQVELEGVLLPVIDRPHYQVAHPDDCLDVAGEICHQCAIAIRPDTGELVLLWLCGGINWSLSRETPEYERHKAELLELGAAA